ncbi:MAG TPA: glycosyltransferase family 4 protein [Polyangiaceae bacterium]|nr:glycosyltransferase family 4 protein [Polyangiaceae bacterium]
MRVAVVTTSYPSHEGDPSGHFVHAEVCALRDAGHDVEVVTPRAGGAFGWPGVAARLRAFPPRAVELATFVRRARAVVTRGGFDRVFAHWALPSAWPVASACRAPLEIVSHGADVRLLASLPSALRAALVLSLSERADVWRFVSQSLWDTLAAALPHAVRVALGRVAVVAPPPLSLPPLAEEAIAARRAARGSLYVSVGRLVSKKRVDRVVAHVATRRSAGEDATLVVVGDGPERPRLSRLARELRVPSRFVGMTTHAEALTWIAAADALAFASEEEGLSTVLREAEALGTAVVHV